MDGFLERLWARLRPFASPGAAVTGGVATYSWWDTACGWMFSHLPEGPDQWFLQNIALLPAWGAATIVGSTLFAVVAWIQYRAATVALTPKLEILVPSDNSEMKGRPHEQREQFLFIVVKNSGAQRLTNIKLYIHCIEPRQQIGAEKYRYEIYVSPEINGGDSEKVFLIRNGMRDTLCALSSGEGPLLPKEIEITLYLRVSCAESPASDAVVVLNPDPDVSGCLTLTEKKWLNL